MSDPTSDIIAAVRDIDTADALARTARAQSLRMIRRTLRSVRDEVVTLKHAKVVDASSAVYDLTSHMNGRDVDLQAIVLSSPNGAYLETIRVMREDGVAMFEWQSTTPDVIDILDRSNRSVITAIAALIVSLLLDERVMRGDDGSMDALLAAARLVW